MSLPLVIFGGTFDPVHTAHLVLAEHAAETLGAETVLFVPAGDPPHKSGRVATAPEDRLAMVKAAIAGNPRFRWSAVELERPGRSYAVDTIRQIRNLHPEAGRPGYLIGSDSLIDLPLWKDPVSILEETDLLVVPRPGFDDADAPAAFRGRYRLLDSPRFDLSATGIRERVSRGQSIRYLVPDPVRAYIQDKGLYNASYGKDRRHVP